MMHAWARSLGLLVGCQVVAACGSSPDDASSTPMDEGTSGASSIGSESGGASVVEGTGGVGGARAGGSGAGGASPVGSGSGGAAGKGGASGGGMGGHAEGGAASLDAGVDSAIKHVVKACPVDGANAGHWEDVSPPMAKLDPNDWYHAAVVAFDMSAKDTSTIYLGSNSEGLFKTTDCGASWVKINTGMNGDALGTGRTWTLVVDFTDPDVVYANSGYGPAGLFKSKNGGVDWAQLFPTGSDFATTVEGNFVENVSMDPTDHLHLLVSTHANCKGAYGPGICFAESADGGSTWKMLKAPTGLGYENGHLTVLDHKTWFWFQPFGGIWRTGDGGATMPHAYDGYGLNSEGRIHRNLDGSYYAASYGGVLKSADTISWTLLPGSPRTISVSGNGTKLIASGDPDNAARYLSSVDSGRTWTNIEGPQIEKGWMMRYDPDHDILYSSNHAAGFWRMIKP